MDDAEAARLEVKKMLQTTNIIKWYQVKMTYEEKFRLGHLTYAEYCAWINELNEKASCEPKTGGKTFWANDSKERENISDNDYNDFLMQNNVSIQTKNNFDDLFSQYSSDASTPQNASSAASAAEITDSETKKEAAPSSNNAVTDSSSTDSLTATLNATLKSMNKAIGGDSILTEDEIQALFAAANG